MALILRLLPLLLILVAGQAMAQSYLAELKAEDLAALDAKLKALGTSYRAEPVLAAYLAQGQSAEFVTRLVERGANPNARAANALSPLALAVTRELGPDVVAALLQGGAVVEARVAGQTGSLIEVALDRGLLAQAALLIKANQRGSVSTRLTPPERYKDYFPVVLDDLVQTRNILRFGNLTNAQVWNLALAGGARRVLKYLIDLQIEPNLNDPGSKYENQVGLDLLARNPELLALLFAEGLSKEAVNFAALYTRQFKSKRADTVRAIKALDTAVRPELYRPALAAGLEVLKALTNNLDELTRPSLVDHLEDVLLGAPAGEKPLVLAVADQSSLETVRPLWEAFPGTGLTRLETYALNSRNSSLLRSLVREETGVEVFRTVTHNFADLTNPTLFRDATSDNGRENLASLLELVYQKTDFATIVPALESLNLPRTLWANKAYAEPYQKWLVRAEKDITSFAVGTPPVRATVTGTQISVVLPEGTDAQSLVATFTLSGGSVSVGGVPQVSGATADFRNPVIYEVTAADGSKKRFTVTVTIPVPAPLPPPASDPEPAP